MFMDLVKTNDRKNRQGIPDNALPRHSIHALDVSRSSFHGPRPATGLTEDILSSSISSPDPNPPIISASPNLTDQPLKLLTGLRNPSLYHTLKSVETSYSLRDVFSQSDPSISLSELIASGHFRSAAIKAAEILINPEQILSPEQIFDLVYKRLACLTLCNQSTLAVQEAKALEDLNSSHYRVEKTNEHLVPWELRILAVRLQGIGFGDVKRGVIGYYDLVSEARLIITSLKKHRNSLQDSDDEMKEIKVKIMLWEGRLSELGLRVANALVEMEDFEGASRLLSSFQPSSFFPNLRYQQALIWLCLGDVEAARNCAPNEKIITLLAYVADAEFENAVEGWEDLIATGNNEDLAMWKQNLAVCLIYLGRIDKARKILEDLTDEGYGFHALTFNLSTIYELCTERNRSLKIKLAEKLARTSETKKEQGFETIKLGWEKANADFKL